MSVNNKITSEDQNQNKAPKNNRLVPTLHTDQAFLDGRERETVLRSNTAECSRMESTRKLPFVVKSSKKSNDNQYRKIVAKNRRAYFEYSVEEVIEAGIVLVGSEVKSIRDGRVNIADSHAAISTDFTKSQGRSEVILYNCNISEYHGANQFNHVPTRPRKLLLHKRQIKKIFGQVKVKGYTLIALSMYFNEKNKVKLELGIAKGKKLYDKRESIKQKDLDREQRRASRVKL